MRSLGRSSVHARAWVREPAILIRINKLYRYGITDAELYDATCSAWVVGERSEAAQYAFAILEGVVREVSGRLHHRFTLIGEVVPLSG